MLFMPSRDWKLRVQDILKAGQNISSYTANLSFKDFQNDSMIVQSVLYNFIIIGEAAANIPDEIQTRYSEIPWRIMADMRNVVAHEYFQVNLTIVWDTVQRSLPPVLAELETIVQQ
jgi:uncharacterized protein with HEPN domain